MHLSNTVLNTHHGLYDGFSTPSQSKQFVLWNPDIDK